MSKKNISIMKKIKTLLILGAMLLIGFAGKSQVGITYRMNNYMVVPGTPYDTLIFDVEAKGNPGTSYTTTFLIKINFNSAAFGVNAVPVVVELLPLSLPSGYNYNTLAISSDVNKFQSVIKANRLLAPFTPSQTYDITYLSNLTTSYQGVARYKMLITGAGQPLNLDFWKSGTGSMLTGHNYVLTSGGTTTTAYTPVLFDGTPTNDNLMFSEIGDPSNSTTNFVEIYNPNSWVVNLNYYPWYLNAGTSSVLLTGSIPAGATYVVAYNNTDFVPNLVSTIVGTGGATLYRLSYFGNYSAGTLFDIYDGSAAGFAYTGKHAVRHYNIILPNMTQTASEWVISDAQNTDMTPGSHHSVLNWAGTTSSDWRTKTNWGSGFIPDAGHNVSITNVGNAPIISNGDNAYCHDLSIVSGGLTVESLPGSDGSLITYGSVTGTATVQRYVGADRYWYVSQPVTSATANVFLHMWLFTYTGGAWTPFIYNPSTPLNLMQGYAVWTSSINSYEPPAPPLGSFTTSYDGVLNSGNQSSSLVTGYNFVGNPYPSAVDWNATGWTKTSLVTNTLYEWNGTTYATYNGTIGSNGGTQYIPAAQGFFVEASGAGTLGVSNAVRTHSLQPFFKSDEIPQNLLSLTISNGEVNDETIIYFNENATSELDYNYDAHKFLAPASPQAYTMLGGEQMAINTFSSLSQTTSVILGVNAPITGEYTITASNIESFNTSTPIFLEDIVTGQVINLREVNTYAFTAEEGTAERFVVHFTQVQGIYDPSNGEVKGIYAVDHNIFVDFKAVKGEISIYNILGREITSSAAKNGLNVIPVSQGNAVYIVKVISDNVAVTKKVFVK
jgi:hypothetical protein